MSGGSNHLHNTIQAEKKPFVRYVSPKLVFSFFDLQDTQFEKVISYQLDRKVRN